MALTHSEKALETLRQMGTGPQNWAMTRIVWKKEFRPVPAKVRCPECQGLCVCVYMPLQGPELHPLRGAQPVSHEEIAVIEKARIIAEGKAAGDKYYEFAAERF